MDNIEAGFIFFVGLVLYPAVVIGAFIGGIHYCFRHFNKPTPKEEKSGWVSIHDEPFRAVVPGKVKQPNSELR